MVVFISEIVKMLTSIFSVTNIISVAFMGYMGNNVYQLSKFWFPGRILKFDFEFRLLLHENFDDFSPELL